MLKHPYRVFSAYDSASPGLRARPVTRALHEPKRTIDRPKNNNKNKKSHFSTVIHAYLTALVIANMLVVANMVYE